MTVNHFLHVMNHVTTRNGARMKVVSWKMGDHDSEYNLDLKLAEIPVIMCFKFADTPKFAIIFKLEEDSTIFDETNGLLGQIEFFMSVGVQNGAS